MFNPAVPSTPRAGERAAIGYKVDNLNFALATSVTPPLFGCGRQGTAARCWPPLVVEVVVAFDGDNITV